MYCKKCWKETEDEYQFCIYCGNRLNKIRADPKSTPFHTNSILILYIRGDNVEIIRDGKILSQSLVQKEKNTY